MKTMLDDGYNVKCICGEEFTHNDWITGKKDKEEPTCCPSCGVSHLKTGFKMVEEIAQINRPKDKERINMIIAITKPCKCGANKPEYFKEYDGALGYEAIICSVCGSYSDHDSER